MTATIITIFKIITATLLEARLWKGHALTRLGKTTSYSPCDSKMGYSKPIDWSNSIRQKWV